MTPPSRRSWWPRVPTAIHEIATDAAAAGKHVFVEKPVAETSAEALRMAAAVDRAGVICHVGFNKRFYYGYRQARRLIAEGALGAPSGLQGRFWYQAGRRDPLLHNGLHFLDLAAFFMGRSDRGLRPALRDPPSTPGRDGRETLAVSMRAERGGVVNLLLSSPARGTRQRAPRHRRVQSEHAVGRQRPPSSASAGGTSRTRAQLYENSLSVHWWSGHDEQGFVPQLRTFAQRILSGRPGPTTTPGRLAATLADGVHSLQVLEGIRRSLEHGVSVTITDDREPSFAKETVR